MLNFCRLLCRSIPFQKTIYRCRCSSIKDAGGKWAEMLKAREGQYFTKKDAEYIEYIRSQLKKGRTIADIIADRKQELKLQDELKQATKNIQKALVESEVKQDAVLTKSHEWMEYLEAEMKKGKKFEDIIEETTKAIKEKVNITTLKKK